MAKFKVIYLPEPEHRCDTGPQKPVGAIVVCSCGKQYQLRRMNLFSGTQSRVLMYGPLRPNGYWVKKGRD